MFKKTLPLLIFIFCINISYAKTIRFAEFSPNRGLRAQALQQFAKKLEKASNKELQIQFFWGGSLLKIRSILKGVGDGAADMGSVVGFLTPKELSLYTLGDLPVSHSNEWADEWVGMRALSQLVQNSAAMQKQFENSNVVYLSNYTTGPIQLICKKKVSSIQELQKTKIRASGPYGRVFSSLGASVQKLSQPAVYQALQTGLVDCNQNYYYSIEAYKQYEVAKNLLELNWGQNMSFGIVINQDFLQKLSPKHQNLIKKVSLEFIDDFAKAMIENRESIRQKLIDGIDGHQVKVVSLKRKDKKKLLKAGKNEIETWKSKNGNEGEKLLREYQKLIKKYQKIKKNKGYPWQK